MSTTFPKPILNGIAFFICEVQFSLLRKMFIYEKLTIIIIIIMLLAVALSYIINFEEGEWFFIFDCSNLFFFLVEFHYAFTISHIVSTNMLCLLLFYQRIGKSGEPLYIGNWLCFMQPFLLGPLIFLTALPCSGGYYLEKGGIPLHDAVGINKKVHNYLKSQCRCQVYGLRGHKRHKRVLSDLTWLPLLGGGRKSRYIIIISLGGRRWITGVVLG